MSRQGAWSHLSILSFTLHLLLITACALTTPLLKSTPTPTAAITATATPHPTDTPAYTLSPFPAASVTATLVPTHTATPSPTATPFPTETPLPTATPAPIVPAPLGLIYTVGNESWVIASDEHPAPWPPPGGYAYYTACKDSGSWDIWVKDRETGEKRNLTNTPDRDEVLIDIWPGRSDVLIFYSYPIDIGAGAGWLGYLSSMRTDGTEYSVLSELALSSAPALSPDGQRIAYTARAADLWVYDWGIGSQRLDVKEYGLESWRFNIYSVSWSPDSNQLACWAWGESSGDRFEGILILDLAAKSHRLLPSLKHPVYFDGSPPAPGWSSDGQWLVFFGGDHTTKRFGAWIVSANGAEIHVLAEFAADEAWDPGGRAWNPDGQWLAITRQKPDPEPGVWLVKVGTWEVLQTNLPAGARVIDWIDNPP